jgi:hypothetical protein
MVQVDPQALQQDSQMQHSPIPQLPTLQSRLAVSSMGWDSRNGRSRMGDSLSLPSSSVLGCHSAIGGRASTFVIRKCSEYLRTDNRESAAKRRRNNFLMVAMPRCAVFFPCVGDKVCCTLSLVWFIITSLLVSHTQPAIRRFERARGWFGPCTAAWMQRGVWGSGERCRGSVGSGRERREGRERGGDRPVH